VDDVRRRVENDELLFDQPVVRHGFAASNRDYDVLVDVTVDDDGNLVLVAAAPTPAGEKFDRLSEPRWP
jgi:hypothetical protein